MTNKKKLTKLMDVVVAVESEQTDISITTEVAKQIMATVGKGSGLELYGVDAYIHPSGTWVKPASLPEAIMYNKAFGGVILVDKSDDKKLVITNDGVMTVDDTDIASRYGLSRGNLANGNPRVADGNVSTDPLIVGELSYHKRDTIRGTYAFLKGLPNPSLSVGDLRPDLTIRNHPELYEEQEKALVQLQEQDNGFHLLSGEVGVGKTHIAAGYINDYIQDNPDAHVLIIEPIEGVDDRLHKLIDAQSTNMVDLNANVVITDDVKLLNSTFKWDLVVFDEFHKMDKNKVVSQFPLRTEHMPDNVLAMTGTVSNTYPEQIWSVAKNYIAKYAELNGGTFQDMIGMAPFNNNNMPQLTTIQNQPDYFVEHVLGDMSVTLLRQDIKELGLEEKMPVNKYSAGIDLTTEDRTFYNFLKARADSLGMSQADQLEILDMAFNTNQKEFVVQPTQVYGKSTKSFRLVDPNTVTHNHDLLFLGRHDQPFKDKKIDFISNLVAEKNEKILVYLTSNDYAERVVDDMKAAGLSAEFVNTHEKGSVKKINDSDADVVVFDINKIMEGIDLHANHVVWYTTPTSAGLDEQACGRITRLSSEQTDKNFYYLYHKTTIQQDITDKILRTNDINNIALKRTDTKTEEITL